MYRNVYDLSEYDGMGKEQFLNDIQHLTNSHPCFFHGHEMLQVAKKLPNDFLKAVIFRDPVDRVRSYIQHIYRDTSHDLHHELSKIEDVREIFWNNQFPECTNFYAQYFSGYSIDFIAKNPEQSISTAIRTIADTYTHIGHTGNIADFSTKMAECIGASTPFVNFYENRNWRRISPQNSETLNSLIVEANRIDNAIFRRFFNSM
jgi:hypothetical protein